MIRLPDSAVVLGVLRQIEKHRGASVGGFFSATTLNTLQAFHLLRTVNGVDYQLTHLAEAVLGSTPSERPAPPSPSLVASCAERLRAQTQPQQIWPLQRDQAQALLDTLTWRSLSEPPRPGQLCVLRLKAGGDALEAYIGDLEGFPLEWREGPEGYGRYDVVEAWRPHVELPVP